MNKKQREVQQLFLDREKEVLKKLEANYQDALDEINSKIELLMARQDADMQHVIYQVEYQRALKDQVSAILEQLHNNEFETISEYLAQSYEDGFIGTMYDLQGQGIPLVIPLDQEQVVAAIQHETKLSESLYAALGKDTKVLSKKIAGEISRGISSGAMYSEIARNVASWGRIPKNNAMRIARTEAHRIQIQATADAQWKAKANGADVVKQWDAALDGKTRSSHRKLDGQIRELDEPFEVNGHKAMQPGGFGRPEEDINCRCALLQRARWALGNDYTKWSEDAPIEIADDGTSQLAYIRAKNYKEFQNKYKQAVENIGKNSKIKVEELKLDNFPDAFKQKSEAKITKKMIDYVNKVEGANPDTIKLFNSMGKLENLVENGISFKISHGKNHAVTTTYNARTQKYVEIKLIIPKLTGDDITGQINTMLHEEMHFMDLLGRKDATKVSSWFSTSRTELVEAFKNTTASIGEDIAKLFKEHKEAYKKTGEAIRKEYQDKIDMLRESYFPNGASIWSDIGKYRVYEKEVKKLRSEMADVIDYESRNLLGGGIGNLQDIYDALSGGQYRSDGTVIYGHGKEYYRSNDSKIHETIANYASLSITRPDLIEMLKKDKPELVTELENTIKEMVKKVGE